ncbi:MAG: PASTA domain-containing protein [Bacilli bacterium]|nr:PASTA domain-containing protein [Bacilli bacterium]
MKQRRISLRRPSIINVIILFLLCGIILKVLYIGLSKKVDGIDIKKFADNRNTQEDVLYAKRGTIYDNNGEVLAQTVNSYTLIAYLSEKRSENEKTPQHVVDKEYTAQVLSEHLNADKESILKQLNKDKYQVEFGSAGRNLSELKKTEIENLELPGIDFIVSTKRYYKMGAFASYIIGYAKTDEKGNTKGEMGIEESYNNKLEGTNGKKIYQKDLYGYQIPNTPSITEEPVDGYNVYLTIDNNIQIIIEKAVKNLATSRQIDWMTFSVIDANTGAIVASASSPSFNPNELDTIKSYLNPLVAYQYEPGSTMKTFSFLAALEEGIYDGSKKFESGKIEVADATIRDFNNKGWGTIDYDTGFAYSSNVAATNLGLALGVSKLKTFYQKAGFGQKTGIELPGEQAGKLNFTYKSELANASFGQGITTTPIQTLQAMTILTNNGTMIKPYLIDHITDNDGNVVYKGKRTVVRDVASSKNVKYMNKLLHNVVYEGLSNYWQPNNVSLIGKTGTAQIASPKGGYLTGEYDYIKSFAGIFPEEEPKYILYVSVKQMVGTTKDLANTVTTAVEEIANYANINYKKDKETIESKIITLKNYISKSVDETKTNLENQGLKVIVIGSGDIVINQNPLKGMKVIKGQNIFLLTNKGPYIMPNTYNWSSSDIIAFCKLIKLDYETEGYGKVKTTSINTGDEIKPDSKLIINLSKD